ncbi:DUF4833 domain-containing protein [Spirosoma endbachense]|uniref:DUF4833 domain-containing protein n=2 Tax=Spirosoma endbachense TaxID=2666025 RepID=A0A6P1VQE5_9BACT|nr:DUF4833 domain-containing protein [Spirosoma endbachense]
MITLTLYTMKKVHSWILVTTLFLAGYLPAKALSDSFPQPHRSANQLFYIQRSKDINTIVYEANLSANKKLDPNKPLQVYWIRYAEKGQREDLSPIQWQMAYGYTHKPSTAGPDAYDINLNAFRKHPLQVVRYQGKPIAMTLINGERARLQKVFVQLDPKSRLVPHVQYIEMYGVDLDKGKPVYERIIP